MWIILKTKQYFVTATNNIQTKVLLLYHFRTGSVEENQEVYSPTYSNH